MKKEDELYINQIDMDEMAHLIHVIPSPDLLRITLGYEVIIDKPYTRENFIDLARRCLSVADEMKKERGDIGVN